MAIGGNLGVQFGTLLRLPWVHLRDSWQMQRTERQEKQRRKAEAVLKAVKLTEQDKQLLALWQDTAKRAKARMAVRARVSDKGIEWIG